jgi:carbon starvation protein
MNVLFILFISIGAFFLTYRVYGGFIDRVFESSDSKPTPAKEIEDARDYVPVKWPVVFAHHFSAIAGGGPIVGPTVALIYGFYPAWLWLIIGAIFFGSVHDFTALFISLRSKGRSIAEITDNTLGRAGYVLFILFTLFMILLVTAAFLGLTATALSSIAPVKSLGIPEGSHILQIVKDPATGELKGKIGGVASTSVIVITLFSPFLGYLIYKKRARMAVLAPLAILIAIISIYLGLSFPVSINATVWMLLITLYVFFAAGFPMWVVLQPRDFVNAFILYGGIAALVLGIFMGGLGGMRIEFPAFSVGLGTEKLGLIWPVLFITVACGAISGFHSLVASGTTSKQLSRESEARKVAFGGMLLEGLLAVVVLITLASVLSSGDYMKIVFPETGKSNPILAFSLGMGAMINKSTGLSQYVGTIFGILLIEGFLITTLDTAVRLNRYLFEELWQVLWGKVPALLKSYHFNAGLSAVLMFLLGYKQAFLAIWPVFGSANQLLSALTLITVSAWLLKRGKRAAFTLLPAAFMVATTIASLLYLLRKEYIPSHNPLLIGFSIALVVLAFGIVGIAVKTLIKGKKEAEATVGTASVK